MGDRRADLSVLFVCTGNICRSPIAAGLFEHYALTRRNTNVRSDSAGIHAVVGEGADPLAIEVAENYGANIEMHRARQFVAADFSIYQHIVALDLGHLEYLTFTRPGTAQATVDLLMGFANPARQAEVPDPYGRKLKHFQQAGSLIESGVLAMLESLTS